MKTYCKACGHPNEIGHLFCTKCSGKLDLTNVSDEIEQNVVSEKRKTFFAFLWIPVILILVVLVALACWPCKTMVSANAASGRRDTIEAALARLEMVAEKGNAPYAAPPLKEEDINTWLIGMGAKLNARSVSVRLQADSFRLRVVSSTAKAKLFGGKVTLPAIGYSYDVAGKTEGGRLAVKTTQVGHLPLFGPLNKQVVRRLEKLFKDRKRERLVVTSLSEVKLEEGTISVTVAPPAR